MSAGDVLTLIGAFAIIILMLVGTYYATRWYARRAGGMAGLGKYIKVIDRASMGAASLLIVEIEGQYYLLGLSDKNMQLICKLDEFTPHPPEESSANFGKMFHDLLGRNKNRNGGEDV